MHVLDVTGGIVLTGKQDWLLFLFSLLTLEGMLSPLWDSAFPPAGERIQECYLSPLPLWILPGRWRHEPACVWCCIHFPVPRFPLMRSWLLETSKGPRVDLLFLKHVFHLALRNEVSFCTLYFTRHVLEMRMRCLNDPQLVKVSLGWPQAFISGSCWGFSSLGSDFPLSELHPRIVSSLKKNVILSLRMKWEKHLSKPL